MFKPDEIPTPPQPDETATTREEGEDGEMAQPNIAHEYLRELNHYQKLNESYQSTLRSLDKLHEEGLLKNDDPIIQTLEGELRSVSTLMDGSQIYMNRLFGQLSAESKEKYLKPE